MFVAGSAVYRADDPNKPGVRVSEIRLDPTYRVNATEALFGDLKVLLGPRCLI